MIQPSNAVRRRQEGATLLIALVFLVIFTMFAISGMNTGIVNLRAANNAQLVIEAQNAAQQTIEVLLGSTASFKTVPTAATTTQVDPNGGGRSNITVVTQPPKCLSMAPAPGYSYAFAGSAPMDTVWEVVSAATDTAFGAAVTVRQGVKVRLPVDTVCVN